MSRFKPKNVKVSVIRLTWKQALPNIITWPIIIGLLVWLLVVK